MQKLLDETDANPETIEGYLKDYLNSPGDLPDTIFSSQEELRILNENEKFLEKEFDAWTTIQSEKESSEEKASRAEPGKPAIILE